VQVSHQADAASVAYVREIFDHSFVVSHVGLDVEFEQVRQRMVLYHTCDHTRHAVNESISDELGIGWPGEMMVFRGEHQTKMLKSMSYDDAVLAWAVIEQ
jgi:hypothetical protein